MGRMYNPPYPGETLREDVLPALGLTVTQAAEELGINRVTLSRVLNGKAWVFADELLEDYLRGEIRRQTAERRGSPDDSQTNDEKPKVPTAYTRTVRRRPMEPPQLASLLNVEPAKAGRRARKLPAIPS